MSHPVLTPVVLYVIAVILAGAGGLCFPGDRGPRKYAPAALIFVASAAMLVYLLATFRLIEPISGTTANLAQWDLPFATFTAGIDGLSAFFLVPLLILAGTCSLYGPQYFKEHKPQRSHWFFFALLVAGMAAVLLARNAVLFVIAWEIMSLASFFLVITDKEKTEAMHAGWIYFVTAHIGTAFLLTLFFLLSARAGSFDFAAWHGLPLTGIMASVVFLLALVGFGLKAGFIPFHVWLPLAHPSAPSHVSALMSGIMIKMGIYGILRIMTFLGPYQVWWGGLLIAIGAVSGILGVLFAIGQHDMKRLLAYHSVENIGIILLGIGIGVFGKAIGSDAVALFGFAGGLLHVLNHALFKGLLFLGAGAVLRQTGSGAIDRMGGIIRTMPRTALLFLVGSIAICGLPFFNGFISELMIYSAGIIGATTAGASGLALGGLVAVASLALIGGLAAACFAKVFGVVFLGEPRTEESARVSGDVPVSMLAAMAILASLCLAIGMGSPSVVQFLTGPALVLAGPQASHLAGSVFTLTTTVTFILCSFVVVAVVVVALVLTFRRKRPAPRTVTWDCGYDRPEASMQYTASSFADPIVSYFRLPLAAHKSISSESGPFPAKAWTFHSGVEDWFLTRLYTPAIAWFDRLFGRLRWFQSGKTGQYVLYIAITVFCLILWKFFL
jgi:hydrogenase-4 component B